MKAMMKKEKIVKSLLITAGMLLLFLGLDVLIFWQTVSVAGLYFLGGFVLIGYAILRNKLKMWVHVGVCMSYLLPLLAVVILAVYGRIPTADFTEDVVFVLGAGLRNDEILPTLEARLNRALDYFGENPSAMFVVCGGYGAGQTMSEARAMADFLIAGGIPVANIILEDASTSTYENLLFAQNILVAYFPEGFRATVVTNAFHQYRAGYLARYLGIDATRYGAPTPFYTWHHNYIRELLAIVNTWLFQTE